MKKQLRVAVGGICLFTLLNSVISAAGTVNPKVQDAQQDEIKQGEASIEGFNDNTPDPQDDRATLFRFESGQRVIQRTLNELAPGNEGRRIAKQIENDPELSAKVRDTYDIFFDAKFGLIANTEFGGWEFGVGQGGFIDMGEIDLDQVEVAPKDGYVAGIRVEMERVPRPLAKFPILAEGHTYVVRTANGKYAKFFIKRYDAESSVLEFQWRFQPDGSRILKKGAQLPEPDKTDKASVKESKTNQSGAEYTSCYQNCKAT